VPASFYKVWAIGPPVDNGFMAPITIGVAGIAKRACPAWPFAVVNELICSCLSRAIILPGPPGFIIANDNVPHYVSMDFNLAGQQLPPVDPELLIELQPSFAAGVITFDIWVLNDDRHEENLSHFVSAQKVQAFDHAHCFFNGTNRNAAHQYLEDNRGALGINGHCLLPFFDRIDLMLDWINRIERVPDFYIDEVVKSTVALGLPETEVGYCSEYLRHRRDALRGLITQNRASFPRTQTHLFDQVLGGKRP